MKQSTKAKVFDITGAGDTVVAVLSLYLLCQLDYKLAAIVAMQQALLWENLDCSSKC